MRGATGTWWGLWAVSLWLMALIATGWKPGALAGQMPAATSNVVLSPGDAAPDSPKADSQGGQILGPATRPGSNLPDEKSLGRRRMYLEELRRILPKSESWEGWLAQSRELPPEFPALAREPFLPEPLRFENGKIVALETWPQRRRELWSLFQRYLFGTIPGSPGNVELIQTQEREEAAAFVQRIVLGFGPRQAARLYLELIVPKGKGPFPVFLTALDHRPWALVAVSRGYVGCLYAGGETQDDTGAWTSIWPEFDWSQLMRRAWAAGRCLDFLHQIPWVDTNRIAIVGHGPNGKVALIAGALDLRIDAVVASSSGAGGACSFRFFAESQFGEGIEPLTREHPQWLHPRLRFFAGRESRLPVDQPQLIACIAPRPCFVSTALHDPGESVWAVEQSIYSARRVYDLFKRGRALTLHCRAGGYDTQAHDVETYLDWLDTVFDRGFFPFPDTPRYPTYGTWENLVPEKPDPQSFPTNTVSDLLTLSDGKALDSPERWAQHREVIRDKIFSTLGLAPSFATTKASRSRIEPSDQTIVPGPHSLPPSLAKQHINFGNDINGDLYLPTGADQSQHTFPAVIWLPPVPSATGDLSERRRADPPPVAMAKYGFVVLAFDQIGQGTRLEEVQYFYHRYPAWSLFGKQIDDALAAVDALLQMDLVDPRRVYLVGYHGGGKTALHAAALDKRVAGVVSVAGFTPMRSDGPGKGTGGLARWSRWLPLHPQLSPFLGAENRLPYDYEEVLALIAPRPALLYAPRLDEESDLKDIETCVQVAGKVFEFLGGTNNLQLRVLEDYNRFSPESQRLVCEQLAQLAGARRPASLEQK
jgi:dienelactone hydrolase